MPVRLIHSKTSGMGIEVGPYTLADADIDRLRKAIASYDEATGRTTP
ncbi:hypothetical protein [Mycobacterium sp. NPDC050041]